MDGAFVFEGHQLCFTYVTDFNYDSTLLLQSVSFHVGCNFIVNWFYKLRKSWKLSRQRLQLWQISIPWLSEQYVQFFIMFVQINFNTIPEVLPFMLLVDLKEVPGLMVFCYQNCSDLLWEIIVLVIEKNFWNSRLKAKDLQIFWDH